MRALTQDLPGRCQTDEFVRSDDQLSPQLAFQQPDLLAYSGLGKTKCLACGGEAPFICQGKKGFQQLDVQICSPS